MFPRCRFPATSSTAKDRRPIRIETGTGNAEQGSALLIVLWVIAFLSFLAITSLMITMQDVETTASRQRVLMARNLAEKGLAVASHPMIKMGDPLLKQKISDLESYEAIVSTEEALINLNTLLTEEGRSVLERVFEQNGVDVLTAQKLVSRMMDWVDPDDLQRLDSWEKQQYKDAGLAGRPLNRPFRNLDEAALVAGMDELTAMWPSWREYFTVWGDGRLDINEASPEVIVSVANISLETAQRIADHRNGPDGVRYTLDDTPIKTIEDAQVLLGVSGESAEELLKLITLQGSTRRVISTGRVGDYQRSITAVIGRSSGQVQMLDWRETIPNVE